LNQRKADHHWIKPLLQRFNLGPNGEGLAPDAHWKQIEECELTDRIGRLISAVNRAAGSYILEMVDFLPPQKNVLRVSFDRRAVKHNLEIVIRGGGITLMFSTTRRASTLWGRYIPRRSSRHTSTLVWEQVIYPGEVSDQNIQAWVSYLLSGLDKKFRLDQILNSYATEEAGLTAALRKASA
jgi:hypothetical protein